MSLIPFILDLADELQDCLGAASMDISDDFGLGIYPHEPPLQLSASPPQQRRTPRSLLAHLLPSSSGIKHRHHPYCRNSSSSTNKLCCYGKEPEKEIGAGSVASKSSYSVLNKNGFQVSMNVKQFAPDELLVKTVGNCIVVEGRHDEKEDGHGVISRHFIRKYMLPKGYDPTEVSSVLSTDGILTVKAPPPNAKRNEPQERVVQIQPTGEPAQVSAAGKEVYKVPIIKVPATDLTETEAVEPTVEQNEGELTAENFNSTNSTMTSTATTANIPYIDNENETEKQIETANERDVNERESALVPAAAVTADDAEEAKDITEMSATAIVTDKIAVNYINDSVVNDNIDSSVNLVLTADADADVSDKIADEANNGNISNESEMLETNIEDPVEGPLDGNDEDAVAAAAAAAAENGDTICNTINIGEVVGENDAGKDVTLDADVENFVVVQPPIEEAPLAGDIVAAAAADAAILLAKAQQQQQCENGNQIPTEEVAN